MDESRICFHRTTQRQKPICKKGIYEDEKDEEIDTGEDVLVIESDLELFLKGRKPLLQSRNSALAVAVVSCYLYFGT
jgi:hypothetical protein